MRELFFTILHTNDEHSALIPHGPAAGSPAVNGNSSTGGFARLATLLKDVRAEKEPAGEPVMLVSSGDIIGSNPFSWLINHGYTPELRVMQKTGYDTITIGNHELLQGADNLAAYIKTAGYPEAHNVTSLLGTNIVAPHGHPLAAPGLYRGTALKELKNGLRVGFLGVMGYDAIEVARQTGVSSVDFSDPVETSRQAVQKLRQQGADVIVAVNHAGTVINKKIAREVPGIDIIIGGHQHVVLEEPVVENDVIIVEAGECLHCAGILEAAFNRETGKLRLRNAETGKPYLVPLDNRISGDREVDSYIDEYTQVLNELVKRYTDAEIQDIYQPVASASFDLPNVPRKKDNPAGNFVTDSMRFMAEKLTGEKVDVAFYGSGTVRVPLLTGGSKNTVNTVSFFDLAELLETTTGPDGEGGTPLVSFYLTGTELRNIMEISALAGEVLGEYYSLQFSGARFEYDAKRTVLFYLPMIDMPLPSLRAVMKAELFTGSGLQTDDGTDYVRLKRREDKLHHVVTDYLLAQIALPFLNDEVPLLKIIPKDSEGKPVEDLYESIIRKNGKHYKTWQAVVEYAASRPEGTEGLPLIDKYYTEPSFRVTPVKGPSLLKWPLITVLPVASATLLFILHRHHFDLEKIILRRSSGTVNK